MGIGLTTYIPLVAYILCFAVVLLTIFHRIEWSLVYLVFFIPLQSILQKMQHYPLGSDFVDILIVAALVRWFLSPKRFLETTQVKRSLDAVILSYMVVTFIALLVGSLFLGDGMPISLQNERFLDWKNLMLLPLLYYITVNNVDDFKCIRILLITSLLSMFVVDYFFYNDFKWVKSWHYSHDMRIGSVFYYLGPNELGAFFVQYSMIVLALLLHAKRLVHIAPIGILYAFSIYSLMYSFSRAGYLAFLICTPTLLLIRNRKLFLVFCVCLPLFYGSLPAAVKERIAMTFLSDDQKIEMATSRHDYDPEAEYDSSAQGRFELWDRAMSLFQKSPLVGVGFGSYKRVYGVDTHSNYFKILAELGLIGFVIYLALYYLAFKNALKLYNTQSSWYVKGLGLGFFTCVLANVLVNLTHDNWTYINLMGFYWVFLALVTKSRMMLQENVLQ